jgi:hypothetical protein
MAATLSCRSKCQHDAEGKKRRRDSGGDERRCRAQRVEQRRAELSSADSAEGGWGEGTLGAVAALSKTPMGLMNHDPLTSVLSNNSQHLLINTSFRISRDGVQRPLRRRLR